MATCANHPIKMATARCKTCNKPLCNECRRVTDTGIYCSEDCESKAVHFAAKVGSTPVVTHRTAFFTRRTAKAFVILVIVAAGTAWYFNTYHGIEDLDDAKALLAGWWENRYLILP